MEENPMIQKPMFSPQTEWIPPESFPDLSKYDEIAIDLETKDPELKTMGSGSVTSKGHIVGIAVAVHDWSGYYPIRHEGGGNMDHGMVTRWLQSVLKTPATKIFHNAMYDVCFLRAERYEIQGTIVDTMIAGSLVDENRFRYDLGSLGRDYIGKGKNEAVLKETADLWGIDAKSEMYKLPAMYVGEYAERDAEMTLELWQEMKKEIQHQDIQSIFDLETELFPCLVDMRFLGVRVDIQAATQLKEKLSSEEKECLLKVKKETGVDTQIWAARSIAQVFEKLRLPFDRTEKTNSPSFTKNFLQNHSHPIVKLIARAREISKAHTTFIDTIIKHEHKGRIHAEINQLRSDQGGTVTGRFSYSNPNLQQIPARNKELGPMIRSLFIPEDGCKWGVFDYSQQEPRLVVHYAALQNLYGVNDVLDSYKDSNVDFHQIVAEMAEIPRSQAKTINLGLFYGMGKNKLQAELGINKEKSDMLFRQYHSRVPFVKQLMDSVMKRAQNRGQIRTLLGRLCRFHLWEPNQFGIHKALPHEAALQEHGPGIKRAYTYKALNRLIQGSAADMTKKAMVELHKEGIVPHIQVHDELDVSVNGNENKIKEIMESAVELEVPNKVDYEFGPNWGTIK
jgi:DNA polymerase I-like protein with 3'-5' exonuclease and polymerase domains